MARASFAFVSMLALLFAGVTLLSILSAIPLDVQAVLVKYALAALAGCIGLVLFLTWRASRQ